MSKIIPFANCAIGLSLSKIWHDTFRIFLSIYAPDCSRELLGNYLSTNAGGLLIGGILAGSLTDSLTPKITFPISMLLIGILSTILIFLYQFPILSGYCDQVMLFAVLFAISSTLLLLLYTGLHRTKLGMLVKQAAKNVFGVEFRTETSCLFLFTSLLAVLTLGFALQCRALVSTILSVISSKGFQCTLAPLPLLYLLTSRKLDKLSAALLILSVTTLTYSIFISPYVIPSLISTLTAILLLSRTLRTFSGIPAMQSFGKLLGLDTLSSRWGYLLIIIIPGSFVVALLLFAQPEALKFNPIPISLTAKHIIIFVRGFCIALGMNSAYVAVANLFKNDPFLARASNYLYMVLFGALAIMPMTIDFLPKKGIFPVLTTIMFVVAYILWNQVPKTESSQFNIRAYLRSCKVLVTKPEFIAVCFVSMVCIGGFYNIIYLFTDASLNNNFTGSLSLLQTIGRLCTFGILALIYLLNISFLKTSSKNCSQYMAFGMFCVGVSCLIIYGCHTQLPKNNLSMLAQFAFWATCLCTGFSQPAAKYAVLSMAQKLGKNIAGAAQSFVTLSNSVIEQQGSWLILGTPYPFGARIYVFVLGIFSILLAYYLYSRRNKVNSYLATEPESNAETVSKKVILD